MRKIILILIVAFFTSTISATEIVATVIFENLTNKKLTSGDFTILNLKEKIEINNAESITITLPEKGKYQFSFVSDEFTAYVTYPTIINNNKNTITIRLLERNNRQNTIVSSTLMSSALILTDEQIEKHILHGTVNFIVHSIDSSIPKEYGMFKEKYGIGLVKENCVVDPLSFKKATKNNQMIFNYLNRKYGNTWLSELQEKPFGIK